jgi:hypothetical protein
MPLRVLSASNPISDCTDSNQSLRRDRALPRPKRRLILLIAMFLLSALAGVLVTLAAVAMARSTSSELPSYALPGAPMDIEMVDGETGYATLGDGQVIRFTITSDDLDWAPLVEGLSFPRGLAVGDGVLYVVELGDLLCEPTYPFCFPGDADEELDIIAASRGRVLAYPIGADGSLGEPRVVVDDLPAATSEHGPNDIDLGPDGLLYLAIAHVDRSWDHPDEVAALDHPHVDWLGTVLRIDPSSGEVIIFASGLRNVYGLGWSPSGTIIGVDNDGLVLNGWRGEELTLIEESGDHGFPVDRSVGPYERRTAFPLYLLDGAGYAGIAWSGDGVLIGYCGGVEHVALTNDLTVADRFAIDRINQVNGCVSSIALSEHGALIGIWNEPDGGRIVILPMDEGA